MQTLNTPTKEIKLSNIDFDILIDETEKVDSAIQLCFEDGICKYEDDFRIFSIDDTVLHVEIYAKSKTACYGYSDDIRDDKVDIEIDCYFKGEDVVLNDSQHKKLVDLFYTWLC